MIKLLNRSREIDSNNALDANTGVRGLCRHDRAAYRLYVDRKDASKSMARFYAMSIEPTLFGEVCLVRRWGRIGARGQRMEHSFRREEEAVALLLTLLRQKRQRGYRLRMH